MGLFLGKDGNDAWLIDEPGSAAQADAASGGDFVKLRLGGVGVGSDGFARGDAHQMAAEQPASLPLDRKSVV